jgi:dienelactone hydrolase
VPTEPVTFSSKGLRIRAVLGRPLAEGNVAAFIDTHGAMSRGGDMGPPWTDLPPGSHLETLVERGYAVLRVARRGYCGSEGKSLPAYAIRQVDGYRPNARQVFEAIEAESADLCAAFEFMSTLPHVDGSRIAVGGLSTGGLASLLAAAREPRFRAVVSMAGGFSWVDGDQVTSRAILDALWRDVAKKLTMPVMILWSANDAELEPAVGESLANALRSEQRRVEHITYPPFGENGHALFAHPEGTKVFSRDLLRFLDTNVRN